MEGTALTPALEGLKHVKSEKGEMLTKPFLEVCKQILPVIDKFGGAMALVKTNIGGNIVRLESKYSSNPSEFNNLYSMVRAEVAAKTANGTSCTSGLLWLTRCRKYFEDIIKRKLTLWVAPSSLCMCLCVCPLSWRGCMSPSSMCSKKLKASFLFSFRDEFIIHVHTKDY